MKEVVSTSALMTGGNSRAESLFLNLLGPATKKVKYKIAYSVLAQQMIFQYSELSSNIVEVITASEVSRSLASNEDVSVALAGHLGKAALFNCVIDAQEKLIRASKTGKYEEFAVVLDAFASMETLDKAMPLSFPHDIGEVYQEGREQLVTSRNNILKKAAKLVKAPFVARLSLVGLEPMRPSGSNDTFTISAATDARNKLIAWVSKNTECEEVGQLLTDDLKDVSDSEVVAVANYVNSQIEALRVANSCVSTLSFVNGMAQATTNHTALSRYLSQPLSYNRFTAAPIYNRGNRKLTVAVDNPHTVANQPSMWNGDNRPSALADAKSVEIAQTNGSVAAYSVFKYLRSISALNNEDQNRALKMNDFIISGDELIDPELQEEIAYRCLKAKVPEFKSEVFDFMIRCAERNHSMDNVPTIRKEFMDATRKDVVAYEKLLATLLRTDLNSAIGDVTDKHRAKVGEKERWIHCPLKDEQNLAFNSGTVRQTMASGCVQLMSSEAIQLHEDWPIGTTEGSTELAVHKHKYLPCVYLKTVDQGAYHKQMNEVTRSFHPVNNVIRYDFTAASGLEYIANFKKDSRWFPPGQVPTDITFEHDIKPMLRANVHGHGTYFEFGSAVTRTYGLHGTGLMISEEHVAYRCIDRAIEIGEIGALSVKQSMDPVHNLASGIQAHVLKALANGHFSQMLPKTHVERDLQLDQIMTKVSKRVAKATFDENYVQIKPNNELILRLKDNPMTHKVFRNLFTAEELFKLVDTDLYVKKSYCVTTMNLTAIRVKHFKHMFSDVPAIAHGLKILKGTVTEKEQRDMRMNTRSMDMVNSLLSMVVATSGLEMVDGEVKGDSDIAVRIMSLNALIQVLERYDAIDAQSLEGNLDINRITSASEGASVDILK